ncbi:MAG: NifU family protein [Acidimicrobiales bacterium]|nr:NifU family protein [Acidimicrobiales bacterium]
MATTDLTPDATTTGPVLAVSEKAQRRVLDLLAAEADPDGLALWVEVMGVDRGEYVYDLYFQAVGEAGAGDRHFTVGELAVVVPSDSVDALSGATLDVNRDLLNPGLMMDNPNTPPAPEAPAALDLHGTPAERIVQVLEGQINPSIASHGGRADLVRFDEATGTVELRLSGGCQGCAQSTATLRNGIEGALRAATPEITEVVDVTDHAGGANPYY